MSSAPAARSGTARFSRAVGVSGVSEHVAEGDAVCDHALQDRDHGTGGVEVAGGEGHPAGQLGHGGAVFLGDHGAGGQADQPARAHPAGGRRLGIGQSQVGGDLRVAVGGLGPFPRQRRAHRIQGRAGQARRASARPATRSPPSSPPPASPCPARSPSAPTGAASPAAAAAPTRPACTALRRVDPQDRR